MAVRRPQREVPIERVGTAERHVDDAAVERAVHVVSDGIAIGVLVDESSVPSL